MADNDDRHQMPPPQPEERDHWLKVLFRMLPMWLRLTVAAIVAIFLIALPLLILFRPWEADREPPAGLSSPPQQPPLEEPAPSPPPPPIDF